MNAWLITWEVLQADRSALDKIAAILSSRKSDASVAELVEVLYLRSTCSASVMAYYANRRKELPFKAQKEVIINGIPHGDRVLCGGNPCWLYARKVSNLKIKIDEKHGKEILSWIEPPTYKWKDEEMSEIVFASEGEQGRWQRSQSLPISRDTWLNDVTKV